MVKRSAGRPGDVFHVERDGRMVLAVVVLRTNGVGVLVASFFKPSAVKTVGDALFEASPQDSLLVARVGDYSLRRGLWTHLGRLAGWSDASWPLPRFYRDESLTGRTFQVVYDDTDPGKVLLEREVPHAEPYGVPDSLLGSVLAENVALKRLHPQ